jgi:hypothetical protein
MPGRKGSVNAELIIFQDRFTEIKAAIYPRADTLSHHEHNDPENPQPIKSGTICCRCRPAGRPWNHHVRETPEKNINLQIANKLADMQNRQITSGDDREGDTYIDKEDERDDQSHQSRFNRQRYWIPPAAQV